MSGVNPIYTGSQTEAGLIANKSTFEAFFRIEYRCEKCRLEGLEVPAVGWCPTEYETWYLCREHLTRMLRPEDVMRLLS